ncbi:NADPH:quinone reductase, variant 2 [Arthrobotrys musiformis]|uniref:Probable quinone oxidoreductase n=2 Tax=Arthrobotrys musiformis TaxID=47236 RepID=A0AAV9VTA2_9PEZI
MASFLGGLRHSSRGFVFHYQSNLCQRSCAIPLYRRTSLIAKAYNITGHSQLQSKSNMSTQRAIQISKTGGTDVLEINQVPIPKPQPGQILVKAAYAGVNFIDTYFRTGLYPVSLPFTLGSEGSGIVEAVGEGVTKYKPGEEVVYYGAGAYTEYLNVPEKAISHIPEGLKLEEAAAILIQGLTALTMLRESYEVKKGDTILIHAAAGGTGLVLVQLAKALGATVIATASSDEKLELARRHGADYLVNYSNGEDAWVKEVLGYTKDGEGVEAVYDGVGKATFEGGLKVAKRKGSLISFGNASGAVEPFKINRLGDKNLKLLRPRLFGYVATQEEFDNYTQELFGYIKSGQLKLNIHKIYPLENIVQAHKDLEGRVTTGKLVLKI